MFPMRRMFQNLLRPEVPLRLDIGQVAAPRVLIRDPGFDPSDPDIDWREMASLTKFRRSNFVESGASELSARDHSRKPEQARVRAVVTTSIGNGQEPTQAMPVDRGFTAGHGPLDRFRRLHR